MGLSSTAAYLAAYPSSTPSAARKNAARLKANEDIGAEVLRIRAEAAKLPGSVFLTLQEKRNFLARVVRAKMNELAADSDLWQEVSITEAGTKRKLPDKLRAIAADNDLAVEGAEAQAQGSAIGLLQLLTGAKK
jgi:hypothetical protein